MFCRFGPKLQSLKLEIQWLIIYTTEQLKSSPKSRICNIKYRKKPQIETSQKLVRAKKNSFLKVAIPSGLY